MTPARAAMLARRHEVWTAVACTVRDLVLAAAVLTLCSINDFTTFTR